MATAIAPTTSSPAPTPTRPSAGASREAARGHRAHHRIGSYATVAEEEIEEERYELVDQTLPLQCEGHREIGLLPDYEVSFDDVADKVIFSPRDGGTTLRKRIAEAERRGLRTLESMLSVVIGGVATAAHLIR